MDKHFAICLIGFPKRNKKGFSIASLPLFRNFAGQSTNAMDEKQIEDKKKHAGEKHPSMKRRDDFNDYYDRRIYMITLEVVGREPVLGTVVGDPTAASGSGNEPRVELTPLGKAVESQWLGIPSHFQEIEVMGLQIMPDHLHGILYVHERLPVHLSRVIGGFKTGCNKAWRELTGRGHFAAHPQTAEDIGDGTGRGLFAKNYNDLILKSYEEFQHWKKYLADNPRRLLIKRMQPELLRPFFDYEAAGYVLNGVGNRSLLAKPKRLNVRISTRLKDEELEKTVKRYLNEAEAGAVLISPSISPGEKMVMRAAFNQKLPTVVIVPNGFTPLTKPKGEQFDACAEGRLLLLSAWEHRNERIVLTKFLCERMNLIALALSTYRLT